MKDNAHKSWTWYRTYSNEWERIWGEAWIKENTDRHGRHGLLQQLFLQGGSGILDPQTWHLITTPRDQMVAATVVQWLGTNVGHAFVRETLKKCGYTVEAIGSAERDMNAFNFGQRTELGQKIQLANRLKELEKRGKRKDIRGDEEFQEIKQLALDGLLVFTGCVTWDKGKVKGILKLKLTLKGKEIVATACPLGNNVMKHRMANHKARYAKRHPREANHG